MQDFAYGRATSAASAVATVSGHPGAAYLGGGTSLIDLMKEGVEKPSALVDVNPLPLAAIEIKPEHVRLGALARNSDVAKHPMIAARYPVLSQALLSGASPQLRNMATVGGNLLQRTRCPYFRDTGFEHCNKRQEGSGCGAQEGYHRPHAVLGGSDQCIATHPSDMVVALTALDAVVHTVGPRGPRSILLNGFYRLPGATPHLENELQPGELIVAVDIPNLAFGAHSHYLKVRDRASFEFALASAGVALDVHHGEIRDARVALGGVGTIPWRAHLAEKALIGHPATRATFARAAEAEMTAARPLRDNAYKVALAERTLVRALETVMGGQG